jgi:uncharacterized protein YjiS (DUF1127 family)
MVAAKSIRGQGGAPKMLEKFRQFVKHYRELQEIDQLGPEELDDLGLTRDELKLLVQAPEKVTERQMAMAARFGLTADDFSQQPA